MTVFSKQIIKRWTSGLVCSAVLSIEIILSPADALMPTTQATTAPSTQPVQLPAEQTRRDFLAIIDRPRVPLEPEEKLLRTDGGIARYHFTYATQADQRVPGILLAEPEILADHQRHPVVIVLHGTGGKKEAEAQSLRELANLGFIAVAIDGRFHGERGSLAIYNRAIASAYAKNTGHSAGDTHPLYYDSVWDQMRLIDYLQSRGDVDPKRIGMMGISKGGVESWLTAAIDPRVAVVVPCISVQSFAWGLANDGWHGRISTVQAGFDQAAKEAGITAPGAEFVRQFYDRLIPGIYTEFDGPKMLPLICPRPLLVISGDHDPMNPVPGLKLCEESTQPAYAAASASERFRVILQDKTGHAINKPAHEEALKWFTRWLTPQGQ